MIVSDINAQAGEETVAAIVAAAKPGERCASQNDRQPMLRGALDASSHTDADFAPALSLLGRFGKPEGVAEASAWLCSDASNYMTGHSLAVEAGYLTR